MRDEVPSRPHGIDGSAVPTDPLLQVNADDDGLTRIVVSNADHVASRWLTSALPRWLFSLMTSRLLAA